MKKTTLIISLLLIVFAVKESYTNSGGPPQNTAGAPGGGNCTNCHGGTAQSNAPELSLTITQGGNPVTSLTAGQTYNLTFTITTAGPRFGFQMAARLASTNLPAGSFSAGTGSALNGAFINHNNQGTSSATGQGRSWSFNWTAPAVSGFGSINFYASGMRANQNNNNSGDVVYLKTFNFPEAVPVQATITPNTATSTACDSSQVTFDFSTTGSFNNGNVFQLQLSDVFGNFTNTTPIGTLASTGGNNLVITGTLPQLSSANYQLRVVSTNPVATSTNRMISVSQLVPPTMFLFSTTFSLTNPSPNHTYQWFKNGTLIPNAINNTLNPGVFGAYSIRASNTNCPTRFLFSPYDTLKPQLANFVMPGVCLPANVQWQSPLSGGDFDTGNNLSVELSDANGQFQPNPILLLSQALTSIPPTWPLNFPPNLAPSNLYKVRIRGTNPFYLSPESPAFSVNFQPAKPIITRSLDTLISSNPSGNQWFRLGQGAIPNATGQKFNPTQSGQYWVVSSNGNCTSPNSDTLAFIGTSVTEVNGQLSLFPNPANQRFTLVSNEILQLSNIILTDLNGKRIVAAMHQENSHSIVIETLSLPNGIYLLQHQNQRVKLVVQH